MTKSEALEYFDIKKDFEKEELRLIYHERYIRAFRLKSSAQTVEEAAKQESLLLELNQAYCTLEGQPCKNEDELQLEFRHLSFENLSERVKGQFDKDNFSEVIEEILATHKNGLAISLLEMGISMSLSKDTSIFIRPMFKAIHMLGRVFIELGMINQGMKYKNFGLENYERAEAYMKIGEYKLAAQHFALELKHRKSAIPIEDICQSISICYFLLNEYENALNIIEEVLPKLYPKKDLYDEICKSKDFATALMVSMYKLDKVSGNKFDHIKIRFKYPVCFKYFQKCYGKIELAFNVIDQFENDHNAYDEFLKKLKPEPFIKENVIIEYTMEELEEGYFKLFNQPLMRSPIYHPK